MLLSVQIKNFKSIVSLVLDLSFDSGSAPNGYKESNILSFLEPTSRREDRLVPIMNIYGANASGKSNIIQSLFCFKRVFSMGIRAVPIEIFSVNKLKELGKTTFIQLEFFIKKKKYQYILEYNEFSIVKEILFVNKELLFSIENTKGNFKEIEIENFDNENLKKRFEVSCLSYSNKQKIQINTFLSSIVLDLPGLNNNLNLASKFLKDDILIELKNEILPNFSIDQLAKSNKEEDINIAFNRITEFIKRLDIDIERLEYKQKKEILDKYEINKNEYHFPDANNELVHINKNNNLIIFSKIMSFHKNENGNDVSFGLHEESVGTILSFGLIGTILQILDRGGVFIIDEIDKSLHTLLLQSLIRVFKDKEYNKNNAQLISTLHNTDILDADIYKMSEFSFVNKNLKDGTFIRRLSSFEGIRNDLNFRDRYLNGLYSGIPYPYN